MKVKSESEVTQSYPTLSNPTDCSLPALLSMGFSRQEYWSGLPFVECFVLFFFDVILKGFIFTFSFWQIIVIVKKCNVFLYVNLISCYLA